jgi:hypothetical protein
MQNNKQYNLLKKLQVSIFYLFIFGLTNCATEDIQQSKTNQNSQPPIVLTEEELQKREQDRLEKERIEIEEKDRQAKKMEEDTISYRNKLKKIKKSNCKPFWTLLNEIPNELEEVSKESRDAFWDCIANKMEKIVTKKYPFTKDFVKKEILYPNGDRTGKKFYDCFASALSRNPETFLKVPDENITARKVSNNSHQILINPPNGNIIYVNFQYNNGKLVVTDYQPLSPRASEIWESLFEQFILEPLTRYPDYYTDGDYWDWDMIESIK